MARLTDLAVEKMRPSDKRREIPDAGFPGLYLIMQPSGARSWALRYRASGRPRKLTLGSFPALKLAPARRAAGVAIEAVSRGEDPASQKRTAKVDDNDSFDAVAREFLTRYAKPKNRSWRATGWLLGLVPDPAQPTKADDPNEFIFRKGAVAARWRGRKITEITGRDILDAVDRIVDAGAPIVANRTFAALRKLMRWSVTRRKLDRSPCDGLQPPSDERKRDRVLTDQELRLVWLACDEIGWPFGPLVRLLILTGQRRDEIGALRWNEIDLKEREITIPGSRMKGKADHVVPLSDQAIAVLQPLRPLKSRAGLVFSTNGETPVSGFSKAKDRLDGVMAKIAGASGKTEREIAPWVLHDLRRTFVSGLPKLSVAIAVAERIVDHRSGTFGGVVGVYQLHEFADEKRQALESWGRHVAAIVSEKST